MKTVEKATISNGTINFVSLNNLTGAELTSRVISRAESINKSMYELALHMYVMYKGEFKSTKKRGSFTFDELSAILDMDTTKVKRLVYSIDFLVKNDYVLSNEKAFAPTKLYALWRMDDKEVLPKFLEFYSIDEALAMSKDDLEKIAKALINGEEVPTEEGTEEGTDEEGEGKESAKEEEKITVSLNGKEYFTTQSALDAFLAKCEEITE